jgi:hypothetical protein
MLMTASLTTVAIAVMLRALDIFGTFRSEIATPSTRRITAVVTDLTICAFSQSSSPSTCKLDPIIWHRVEKELYLHKSRQRAWLYVALKSEEELGVGDLLVTDIRVDKQPLDHSSGNSWYERPGGIWVLRSKFSGKIDHAVTDVDVLFGEDAVDPRPQWTLMQSPLRLDNQLEIPVARLSVLYGRAKPRQDARANLRVTADGKFKIIQISDTHMVTGVGICKDAIDANGKNLPESEADPLTVKIHGRDLRCRETGPCDPHWGSITPRHSR